MRIQLLVASIMFGFGCQAAVAPPDRADGTVATDGVSLTTATPERLTGSYLDPSGVGIRFDSARVGDTLYLDLTTRAGVQLVHAETVGDTYVFSYLGGRLTLTIDKSWVAAVQAEEPDGPASQDESAMHWNGDMNVLDEMLSVPEVKLLPWMSRALGAEGFTGSAFPASLALHKMARQSADALDIQLPQLETAASDNAYCSRPSANECYGMCGNGCSCWSWVCGDCCYHGGCAKHDSWCRAGKWYYCYNISAVVALFGC
jgi:hypothetical protein